MLPSRSVFPCSVLVGSRRHFVFQSKQCAILKTLVKSHSAKFTTAVQFVVEAGEATLKQYHVSSTCTRRRFQRHRPYQTSMLCTSYTATVHNSVSEEAQNILHNSSRMHCIQTSVKCILCNLERKTPLRIQAMSDGNVREVGASKQIKPAHLGHAMRSEVFHSVAHRWG